MCVILPYHSSVFCLTLQIIMEGIVGFDYTGDIALDDLAVVPGDCQSKCLPVSKSELHEPLNTRA